MRNFIYVGLGVALVMLASCATVDYSFVNPNAKVASEKKVAVFPFAVSLEDYAMLRVSKAGEEASSLVNQIFLKELCRRANYKIISPVEVSGILSLDEEKMDWVCKSFLGDIYQRSALTASRLRELGSQLDAAVILVGKVTDFGRYQQNGALWTSVGLAVKMVDVESGEILWEARDKVRSVSTITHGYSTLEENVAIYPVVTGAVDKEPKYKTGQGYFYGLSGDFPYHIEYKNAAFRLCRNIISTLPRY